MFVSSDFTVLPDTEYKNVNAVKYATDSLLRGKELVPSWKQEVGKCKTQRLTQPRGHASLQGSEIVFN